MSLTVGLCRIRWVHNHVVLEHEIQNICVIVDGSNWVKSYFSFDLLTVSCFGLTNWNVDPAQWCFTEKQDKLYLNISFEVHLVLGLYVFSFLGKTAYCKNRIYREKKSPKFLNIFCSPLMSIIREPFVFI